MQRPESRGGLQHDPVSRGAQGRPDAELARALEDVERKQAVQADAGEPQSQRYGVGALFLFGSAARGEAREDSDIDLIVDFTRPVGLFDFIGLQQRLAALLGRRVDLVSRAALKPGIRDRVLREAIRAA